MTSSSTFFLGRRTPELSSRLLACLLVVSLWMMVAGAMPQRSYAQTSEPIETIGPPPGASVDQLIAGGFYREAAEAAASQQPPYDLRTSLARGELLLLSGYGSEAEPDFLRAQKLTPASEPLADYALALCAMERRDLPAAALRLQRCSVAVALTPERQNEVSLARAALAAALGKGIAPGVLASDASLLAQELAAFPLAPASLSSQASPWDLPGGVARVEEPPGLRADALVAQTAGMSDRRYAIAAAPLAGTDLASQIVSALLPGQHPAAGAPPARRVAGLVTVSPPASMRVPSEDVVSFLVDGDVSAVSNADSPSFRWDTRQYPNGRHTVQIEISGTAGQSDVPEIIQYFDVHNAAANAGGGSASSPAGPSPRPAALSLEDQTATDDAWRVLEMQPSYAIGEAALAVAAARSGNAAASLEHAAAAEAIDFQHNAAFLHQLDAAYAHRLPFGYPNVDRSRSHPESTTVGIWRGSDRIREVALTFDDGPSPYLTAPLLDALQAAKATATFFVVGKRAQLAPELVRRMHREGHEVEDHSYSHPNLDEATPQHVYEEILRNAVIVKSLTGVWPQFLRPPGGQTNPRVLQQAARCGMAGAFWTIDALSAEDSGSPAAVTAFVLKRIEPGAVILMHNGPYATTHAIPGLVAGLRQRGYKIVSLRQLARDACGR